MRWSVVIPYYNEASGIEATLRCAGEQMGEAFRLILIDNASTDGSEAVCRRVMADYPHVEVEYLREARPGQVHALKRGLDAVRTELVAIWDADTLYPRHYLRQAALCFDRGGPEVAAVMAWLDKGGEGTVRRQLSRVHRLVVSQLWPWQNHTSGPAQTFRTAALRAAGGYDPAIWPFVIKDHELVNRVLKHGRQVYHPQLWCRSSDRRKDRSNVRWTLWERLVYHLHPSRSRDWFFNDYLKPRFVARGQLDTKLRERAWEAAARVASA
ncbi:MAG: glycosyltransferase family 2 protein [Sphingomonadaceae bacterium]|nr:glycosyltransferase family 2 protein [Sphingomonadaceae bacterium]